MKHINPSELKVDPYKTALELGITKDERHRLIDLTSRLPWIPESDFKMSTWSKCIKGHMYSDVSRRHPIKSSPNMYNLFLTNYYPNKRFERASCWKATGTPAMFATKDQAQTAIMYFLAHGLDSKPSGWRRLRIYLEKYFTARHPNER